jgi:hypothetical protein
VGHVNEEILIWIEYLAAENEILKSKLRGTDKTFENWQKNGTKPLKEVSCIVKPETIMTW